MSSSLDTSKLRLRQTRHPMHWPRKSKKEKWMSWSRSEEVSINEHGTETIMKYKLYRLQSPRRVWMKTYAVMRNTCTCKKACRLACRAWCENLEQVISLKRLKEQWNKRTDPFSKRIMNLWRFAWFDKPILVLVLIHFFTHTNCFFFV